MNETMETLLNRRSVREFKPEQIKDDELDLILQAGMYAPSGMGGQSPIFIVVQDKDTIAKLSKMNAEVMGMEGMDPFHNAPTVIVVLAKADAMTAVEDGSLAIGNMMNAAYSLGIGACWVHRAKQTFDSDEGKAMLKEWGVEGDYRGIGNIIMGYPNEKPEAKPRKEDYVYYVK